MENTKPKASFRSKWAYCIAGHVAIVAILWFWAQCRHCEEIPQFIRSVGSLIYAVPLAEGELFNYLAGNYLKSYLGHPTWQNVAFILHYSILLTPIIWQPFRNPLLNYALPILILIISTVLCALLLVLSAK